MTDHIAPGIADGTANHTADRTAEPAASAILEVSVRRRLPRFNMDVSFTMAPGICAIVGPSGSGKTLTLRAISGLLLPSSGRIRLGTQVLFEREPGRPPRVNLPTRLRNTGYLFQHYALFPHLSVVGNIGYGLSGQTAGTRNARTGEMLQLIQLEDAADRRVSELSGGEQQRVALARALAARPSLLLLDEPLSALDAPLRRTLGDALRRIHESNATPMLLVTHDPDEAARIADRIITLKAGRVERLSE